MRVGSDDPLFMPNYWGQITWKKNYLCGESPFQPLGCIFHGLKHVSHAVEYTSHAVGYNFVGDRNYVNTHTEPW